MNYQQQQQPQGQPQDPSQAVPFSGTIGVSDKGAVPDGTYSLQLTKIETYVGTKFQSTEPQSKLRFVLAITAGPLQGEEFWQIENLPAPGKDLGLKSGARKFLGVLRGKPLVDGDKVEPASLIGTQLNAMIVGGKITNALVQPPAQVQQPPPVAQPPSVQTPEQSIQQQVERF